MDVRNKRICIIGAAKSGIAAANLALALGARPKISDARPLVEIEQALAMLADRAAVEVEAGGHTRAFIEASDLVVASPGVWRMAEPLEWARVKGIPVMGEIEFAWRQCRKPVIAVTGSNGKTTTVNLITRVIEASGKSACLCGNVGTPYAEHVRRTDVDFFVVEISSFQLELIDTFRPAIAVLLNFSQNHLDRHANMQEYFEAKKRLFMNQKPGDVAVLNAKDEWALKATKDIRSKVRFFTPEEEGENPNHLAVLEVARALGIADAVAQKVFDDFPGVEHRLEKVRVLDGVQYINDSKSTTVEAGRWALQRMDKPVVMIAGGSDKHMDYTPLRDLVKSKVRVMVAIGVIKDQLKDTFGPVVPVDVISGGLEEAVVHARKIAHAGESILLSPMTASFDMFKNFEERGRKFKEIVGKM
ncbi:MAG: UDP-N-acetylmuramoyl-L-alanine--D-glutamate ligase [Candidatus Omnitrophica bacterium]|nr:UDP-N-acetylmuramoyl-L-alanine--D-glutamate ligase [Candidatus Omnitrophota bacterium]